MAASASASERPSLTAAATDWPWRGTAMAGVLHAGLVAAALLLLGQDRPPPDPPVIELVMLPAPQPATAAPEPAPVPAQQVPEPQPAPQPEAKPEPEPLPRPIAKPVVKPAAKPVPPTPRPAITAPAPATPAPAASAPSESVPAAPLALPSAAPVVPETAPAAPPAAENYGAILHAWLQRFRDYPEAARLRHQEGVVQVALTLDGSGRLLQARLYQSGGFALLDRAALAMAERAAPYPPPQFPPGVTRTTYIVPIRYALEASP